MAHALVTVAAVVPAEAVPALTDAIDRLGNPAAPDLGHALGRTDADGGTHFASLHAIAGEAGGRSHLVLELSGDGDDRVALGRFAAAMGTPLVELFARTRDWRPGGNIVDYLLAHRVKVGHGWFDHPGLAFAGTPGMTVPRIRDEADLAARVATLLAEQPGDLRALDRLARVRGQLAAEPAFSPLLASAAPVPDVTPALSPQALIVRAAADFARTFLWPVVLVVVVAMLVAGVRTGRVGAVLHAGWAAFGWSLLAVVVLGIVFYALLRRQERADAVDERAPDPAALAASLQRENHAAQNHMISVTRRKPGPVRWIAIRLMLWLIAVMSRLKYQPGHLGAIGTIHFARWVTLPGTRDYIFFSNFGGSWESYLEDFITKAHMGLTGAWSSSVGFPRSRNLVQGGATDGERFKRYARRSMQPTRFWYSAYPHLTTDNIRTNARIRRGLVLARGAEDATRWLSLFGSAERPASKIESSDIQSLVFGGLGFMPEGRLLVLALPGETAAARALLSRLKPHIAFNDGRLLRRRAVVTLALGARALERLGLDRACLDGFPPTFLDGMAHAERARILGDVGPNGPEEWWWKTSTPEVALLLYGEDEAAVARLDGVVREIAGEAGATIVHDVALAPVGPDKREPFGFVDGVSQPVIRGTYKGLKRADPIHLVEAGEFLIGYPDNRGNLPPGPRLAPGADPDNLLPVAEPEPGFGSAVDQLPREVARNCSFLVIRQLEQDVPGFDRYCAGEAERLKDRLGAPYHIDAEFIGAKMVGRWKDGSSLVRHPYRPLTEEAHARATARPASAPDAPSATPVPPAPRPSLTADNDFLFGAEDPEALRCPFGAHIRRANPRDSLAPGSADQVAISNRHRILRVGRLYRPAEGQKPGLMFMCLNGDIERQFEFVQQTWLGSPTFHGLAGEVDPLLGAGGEQATGLLAPSRDGPVRLAPMPRFVTMRGGGYFLLPSRRLIDFLSRPLDG